MKARKAPLVGDLIRAGLITREDVVRLVGQLFDGKRTLPVGSGGCQVVLRRHDGLTKHLQECLTTILLTSDAVSPVEVEAEALADTAETDGSDAATMAA
jgi:hypothetical protein